MAGPAAAIVGCAITIFLALDNFGEQAIVDGGVKQGLKVERVVPVPADSSHEQSEKEVS